MGPTKQPHYPGSHMWHQALNYFYIMIVPDFLEHIPASHGNEFCHLISHC